MQPLSIFKHYLQEKMPPAIRHLHITIMLLIIAQIIISNFIEVERNGEIGTSGIEFYATWTHFITGLTLVPLIIMFVVLEFKRHGFSYFYPYLSGNFKQITPDIKQLLSFKLPEAQPYGLAAIIQGLGLGAILLVVGSGLTWFIGWNIGAAWEHDLKELHEFLTSFVEAYLIGHGLVGLLHVFLLNKEKSIN
ncbi:MAG: hypothetical protein COB35_04275 [Gammaproteobacteria bacterium]|nr:MAG: hypothetical protein COB35_04275 [Gammaproteobacteria bacterium]